MDEAQAIALLKSGSLEGLEPLVRSYYFQAVRTAYLILQDKATAEDVVQTAYMHAAEKISQLSSERFGPWFLTIVVNASLKKASAQKRRISLDAQEDEDSRSTAEWLVDQGPSPEKLIEQAEQSRAVWQALALLAPAQRAAVVMKYYLDMSEAEVSLELGTSRSAVKWRLYTARQKLRSLLKSLRPSPPQSKTNPSTRSDQKE